MPIAETTQYVIKCLSAGLPPEQVAARVGKTVEEVLEIQRLHKAETAAMENSGHNALVNIVFETCSIYRALGESIKTVAVALDNSASIEDLMQHGLSQEQATQIVNNFIILRQVRPGNLAELIKQAEQAVAASRGN